jgi:hypothetical protein
MPTLGDYLYPLISDIDPDNGIEEAYKQKHQQLFSWRFLRLVSFLFLVNFHGKPELQKQFHKFEGSSETQSIILYQKNKRKEVF